MIMILTGKCKGDFEKWSREVYDNDGIDNFGKRLFYISSLDDYKFIETDHYIENCGETMLNALIIEWFDSVGICIEIDVSRFNDRYGFDCGFYYDNFNDYIAIDGFFNSRQGATEQAIIKANEIYNETKA